MTTSDIGLADVLTEAGVVLGRQQGDELYGLCPVHEVNTGKPDHKPSWSINTRTHVWFCFSCGGGGTLRQLLDFLEYDDQDVIRSLAVAEVKAVADRRTKRHEPRRTPGVFVDEYVLTSVFRDVPDDLLEIRSLDRASADAFQIRWNHKRGMWVIPVRSFDGALMGWQLRCKGQELNQPDDVAKSLSLFGLKEATGPSVILVESPLDVVRMAAAGVPGGLATYGAHPSVEQMAEVSRRFRSVILAYDNDGAGAQGAAKAARLLRGVRVKYAYYRHTRAKDPGDMTDDEIAEMVRRSSSLPEVR